MIYLLSVYPSEEELEEDFLRTISFRGFELSKQNLHELINLSKKNPSYPILTNQSMVYEACDIMQQGLHRMPMLNNENKVCNILSQTSVVSFIHKNIHKFPSLAKMSLRELQLENTQNIHFVLENTPTIKVLNTLFKFNVPSVVVKNSSGHCVANFSVSDIRGMNSDNFVELTSQVKK